MESDKTNLETSGHIWAHCLLLVRDFCTSIQEKEMVIELLLVQNLPLAEYCVEGMYQAAGGKKQTILSRKLLEETAVSSLMRAIQEFNPLRDGDFRQFAKETIIDDLLNLAMDNCMNPKADNWEDIASRKSGGEEGGEWERFLPADSQNAADQLELLEQAKGNQKVQQLIASLPEEFMQQVMELRYVQGFDQKEVASRLGVRLERVKGNEQKALIMLRTKLKGKNQVKGGS